MELTGTRRDGDHATVVCGWCGKVLRHSLDAAALTSHGICRRCAGVLEEQGSAGQKDAPATKSDDLPGFLEERLNELMCGLYESRQTLLEVQKRVRADGELLGRIGQALASVRQQERVLVHIQRRVGSWPD